MNYFITDFMCNDELINKLLKVTDGEPISIGIENSNYVVATKRAKTHESGTETVANLSVAGECLNSCLRPL